jgi:hypothetical protein
LLLNRPEPVPALDSGVLAQAPGYGRLVFQEPGLS